MQREVPNVLAHNAPHDLPNWVAAQRTCVCLCQLSGEALHTCPSTLRDEKNRVLWRMLVSEMMPHHCAAPIEGPLSDWT